MVKHYWKVRVFYGNVEIPIDINCKTREEAREKKNLHKKSPVFHTVKMYKVIPFTYPNPLVTQKGLQCEYLQEVR